jgi:hypothetical protein
MHYELTPPAPSQKGSYHCIPFVIKKEIEHSFSALKKIIKKQW